MCVMGMSVQRLFVLLGWNTRRDAKIPEEVAYPLPPTRDKFSLQSCNSPAAGEDKWSSSGDARCLFRMDISCSNSEWKIRLLTKKFIEGCWPTQLVQQ